MHLLTKFSADLPEGASDPGRNHASILLTNRPCRLPPAHPGMKLGRAHASLWIPALTLTPTLSLREREIWLLLLSVPLEEVRHSVDRASPTGGLAGNKPHPYIFLCRLSGVHIGQAVVGVACLCRNLSSYQVSRNHRLRNIRMRLGLICDLNEGAGLQIIPMPSPLPRLWPRPPHQSECGLISRPQPPLQTFCSRTWRKAS